MLNYCNDMRGFVSAHDVHNSSLLVVSRSANNYPLSPRCPCNPRIMEENTMCVDPLTIPL
uniref:Uncharacterized protein n=1 Tax=Helianthus annuus TaxID=4232 RepID=A0A251TJD4_HELAN